ncbi:SAM-dependent methyltransferase [Paenibacillaceae bacterium]|nr:SAM-dependent methyltransferase [Paenibacillaceae bacterium]
MIVTTSIQPAPETEARARQYARELGFYYVLRRSDSLTRMAAKYSEGRLLVVSERDLRYYDHQEPHFSFHPSMAFVRVKRLRNGERDTMLEVSGCKPGDTIVDCTAGLGSDAIVFSYAAGSAGNVIALESQPLISLIVREGLQRYDTGLSDVNDALRRIEARCEDHLAALAAMPDKSCDIVYFDPMFRSPIHTSSSLQPLRASANSGELREQAVREAVRVASKSVVLKEHRKSGEFERLGFERRATNTSKIVYGVITP